ncbi:MAG: hypothetical protein AAFN74_14740 [Myxococcota bacterium]
MSLTTTSIDPVARGFVRYRFIRTMTASLVVLSVIGFLYLILSATLGDDDPESGLILTLFASAIVTVLIGGALLLTAVVAVAIIDLLHRRGIAALALVGFGLSIAVLPLAMLGAAIDLLSPQSTDEYSQLQNFALFSLAAVATLVAWEGFAWARWQVTIDDEGFRAVQGWRPPGWHIFATFRRLMGLPMFVAHLRRGQFMLTLLYFAVAVLNVGVVAACVLPFLAFGDETTDAEVNGTLGVAAFLIGLLVLNLLGAGRAIARLAERWATTAYQGVREWDSRAPVVVLRTFEQDDEQLPALVRHPLLRLPAGVSTERTLDEVLLEHASPYGPVIAIGDPRDPVPPLGAARIFVTEPGSGWQTVVTNLVHSSRAVIMCPNITEGVKWELDLVEQHREKLNLIYVANPELSAEVTAALFQQVLPAGDTLTLAAGQAPIAAFRASEGWRVLTTSVRPSVQTYTIAVNIALQSLLGRAGVPLEQPRKRR